jgi:hypothetical protein
MIPPEKKLVIWFSKSNDKIPCFSIILGNIHYFRLNYNEWEHRRMINGGSWNRDVDKIPVKFNLEIDI